MSQTIELVQTEEDEVGLPEATVVGLHVMAKIDVYETADEVVVLCDMPGVNPQDVKVKFDKGELRLFGKVAERETPGRCVSLDHGIGDFHRTFAIARDVDADKISAECSEGVVTLHLPKKESVKARQIQVKLAGGQAKAEDRSSARG